MHTTHSPLTWIALAFCLVLFCGQTGHTMPGNAPDSFSKTDSNNDGFLSWDEFVKAFPSLRKEAFEMIDTNKDKRISRDEWDAFKTGHGKPTAPASGAMEGMGGMNRGNAGSIPAATDTIRKPSSPITAPDLPLLSAPGAKNTPSVQTAPSATNQTMSDLPLLSPPNKQTAPTKTPATEKGLPLLETPRR